MNKFKESILNDAKKDEEETSSASNDAVDATISAMTCAADAITRSI